MAGLRGGSRLRPKARTVCRGLVPAGPGEEQVRYGFATGCGDLDEIGVADRAFHIGGERLLRFAQLRVGLVAGTQLIAIVIESLANLFQVIVELGGERGHVVVEFAGLVSLFDDFLNQLAKLAANLSHCTLAVCWANGA